VRGGFEERREDKRRQKKRREEKRRSCVQELIGVSESIYRA